VEDTLHALERTIDGFRIPHIRDNQFCAADRGTAAGGMHIGTQRIENPHLVSACEATRAQLNELNYVGEDTDGKPLPPGSPLLSWPADGPR
jgi:hypothetical protein